jgi:hypothetical protein
VLFDLYNVTNNQTGYNIQNQVHSANLGAPRTYFDPRIFRVGFKFTF